MPRRIASSPGSQWYPITVLYTARIRPEPPDRKARQDESMARIFITGSADGLGRMAGELLLADGHEVIFHARNKQRATDAGREHIVVGDLSSLAEVRKVAEEIKSNAYDHGPI